MKNIQQGFIGIVLIIVAALAIGGGVYYQHKNKVEVKQQVDTSVVVNDEQKTVEEQKPAPAKKPVVLSFEAKARAAAKAGECGKKGTIGAATNVQEEYEYALFTIDGSTTANYCAVDLYAGTITAINSRPLCDANGENCHGTGLMLTPKKLYESIPVAPDPSTL